MKMLLENYSTLHKCLLTLIIIKSFYTGTGYNSVNVLRYKNI